MLANWRVYKGILFLLLAAAMLLGAPTSARAQFNTVTVNGTIAAGEYGVHTDGENQQTSGTQVWYVTWDVNNLYIGISVANVAEGAVVYIDTSPILPINGGTNANGTLVGQTYDSTNFAALPFRADFVTYVRNSYREYRTANGSGGWSAATTGFGAYADNGSNVRELAIPWTAMGGRPTALAWYGYVTSAGGFVYGQAPVDNPGGAIGTSARYAYYYTINNTNTGTSTKPFALKSYTFNNTADQTLTNPVLYDLTMNMALRILTCSGTCALNGSVRIDSGTLQMNTGATLQVKGNFTNNASFTPDTTGTVVFNGTGDQAISGSQVTRFYDLTVNAGSRLTIPATNTPRVNGAMTVNVGGTLRQQRTLNAIEAWIPFLEIRDSAGSGYKYRAVEISSATYSLGLTEVRVKTVATDDDCTTDPTSPAYALRCFSITVSNNQPVTIKLWALNSQLNGLAVSELTVYRNANSAWNPLPYIPPDSPDARTGTVGAYSYVMGQTPGFSGFLVADEPNDPTAVKLQELRAQPPIYLWAAFCALLLILMGLGAWVARRRA
jgi:hypothetical protein